MFSLINKFYSQFNEKYIIIINNKFSAITFPDKKTHDI